MHRGRRGGGRTRRWLWLVVQWAVAAAVVFALSGGYYIPWAWRAALLILLVLIAATSWTQLNAQPEADDSRTDS